jgi:hypothetical protein
MNQLKTWTSGRDVFWWFQIKQIEVDLDLFQVKRDKTLLWQLKVVFELQEFHHESIMKQMRLFNYRTVLTKNPN